MHKTSGERIRSLRKKLGFTQLQMAQHAGLQRADQIRHIESGHRRLSAQAARRLRFMFGVDIDWLYGLSGSDNLDKLKPAAKRHPLTALNSRSGIRSIWPPTGPGRYLMLLYDVADLQRWKHCFVTLKMKHLRNCD